MVCLSNPTDLLVEATPALKCPVNLLVSIAISLPTCLVVFPAGYAEDACIGGMC